VTVARSEELAYRVRRAGRDDGAAVERELRAYLEHIGAALDSDGLDHDVAEWQAEYDGVSGVLLILEAPSGDVVGTAGVRQLEPGLGEVKRMWIRPACQGLGLGRRLMDRCLEEADRLGFRRLRLDTQRRMEAALTLYRSYGFRDVPDYNGNPRAQIWLELDLDERGADGAEARHERTSRRNQPAP
jgi:ribosomal protein S18 acetylase RimI-like enzyme